MTSQAVVSWAGGVGGGEDSGDDGIVGADDGVSEPVPQQDVVNRTAPIRAAVPRSRHLEAGLAAALGEWVTAFMLAPFGTSSPFIWLLPLVVPLSLVMVPFTRTHRSLSGWLTGAQMVDIRAEETDKALPVH